VAEKSKNAAIHPWCLFLRLNGFTDARIQTNAAERGPREQSRASGKGTHMKKLLLAAAALMALALPAKAADLSIPAPVFKSAATSPVGIWTGCYLNGLMGVTGAVGVSGGPDAGGKAECLTENGSGFVYGAGVGMVFTKLASGPVSSPLTADMDFTLGYAFRPMLGTIAMIPFNDVEIYVSPSLAASQINTFGSSSMDTGWMIKGGVATAMSYTPDGHVASTLGVEYRQSKIDNIESHTWMAVMKLRMAPILSVP
jgi:hypothetical protein